MIDSIEISGFKSFKHKSIALGKLTVLTGLNNSGKSSIIQAMRMCGFGRENSGPHIAGLGGYSELKSQLTPLSEPIDIVLQLAGGTAGLKMTADGFSFSHADRLPFLQFVSADRFGPRVQLPIMREDTSALTVGDFGEYSAHYASVLENTLVAEPLRHAESTGNTLKHQLTYWMGEISPGIKIDFEMVKKYDTSRLAIDGLRSTNSGFGISYVLPIILCLLTMSGTMGDDDSDWRVRPWFEFLRDHGGLLLIENPEAHLHPKGQTCMGRLIALAAARGVQIVVETHSDHVLDGIRIAVRHEPHVSSGDIKIKFLSKAALEESEVCDINIREDGKLDEWPRGFFDQSSINLRSLASKK